MSEGVSDAEREVEQQPFQATNRNHRYATGAANKSESITSSTPPKPGTDCDASFVCKSRLSSDSPRSPNTPARPTVMPNPTATRQPGSTGQMALIVIATITDASMPPIAPCHVFFGLSRGAI